MKIESIEFKNINGLPDQDYDMKGQVVLIVAKNGMGKSLIEGVASILTQGTATSSDAKRIFPSDKDQDGVISGRIVDENGNEYHYEIVSKTTDAGTKRTLVVKDQHGGKYGKKETILSLFGNPRVFNAEEYVANQSHSAGITKNEKMLTDLLGIDLSAITEEIQSKEEERKAIGSSIKDTEQTLKSLNITEEQVLQAGEERDVSHIKNLLELGEKHNQNIARLQSSMQSKAEEEERANKRWDEITKQIKQLADEQVELKKKKEELEVECSTMAMKLVEMGGEKDISSIRQEYEEAVSYNAGLQTAHKIKPEVAKLPGLRESYTKVDADLAAARLNRKKMIDEAANKSLPSFVGVSLDDRDKLVLTTEMNGQMVPITTAPSSRVPVTEALMNAHFVRDHRLKIIPVRNASLLDKQSRSLLIEKASEVNASIWMEIVNLWSDEDGVEVRVSEEYTEPPIQ